MFRKYCTMMKLSMKDFFIKSEKIRRKLVAFNEEIFNGKMPELNIVFCVAKMSVKE